MRDHTHPDLPTTGQPDADTSPVRRALTTYGYTSLLCLAIATGIWVIDSRIDFAASLFVSFSIGLSVSSAFLLLEAAFARLVGPYLAPIPIAAIGLSAGLIIAGVGVAGNPWLFFVSEQYTLVLGVFFSIIAYFIFAARSRLIALKAELAIAQAQRAEQEKATLATELKLLQAQIEPHFLFNTLSNVIGMIRPRPDDAEATLVHLTTLLRASLKRTRQGAGSLGDELDLVQAYLEIQRIRMGERLRFTIDCTAPRHLELPPLLIQPLVENAVRHGIDPLEDGGEIHISVFSTANPDTSVETLNIVVSDTGQGLTDSTSGGTGTGLTNVRARLRSLFEGAAKLTLSDVHPSGLTARLDIPVRVQTSARDVQ